MKRLLVCTTAIGLAALAGCSSSSTSSGGHSSTTSTPSAASSSSTSTPKPVSSSTSTSSDPWTKKKTAAIAAVVAFWKKVDQLSALSKGDLTSLNLVARDQVLAQFQYNISAAREQGETAKGSTIVEKPSAATTSNPLTYKVSACIDVSKVTPYKKGKPRSVPPGTSRTDWTYGVTQDAKTLKWYVTTEKQAGTC